MIKMDVVLVGFGTVGQGVAESIFLKNNLFKEGFGDELKVVAAFDSKTYVADKKGLDPMALVKAKTNKGVLGQRRTEDIKDMLPEMDYDVLIEMTPTNINDAKPGIDHFRAAFSAGKDVVTSNKGAAGIEIPRAVPPGAEEPLHDALRGLGGRRHPGDQPGQRTAEM